MGDADSDWEAGSDGAGEEQEEGVYEAAAPAAADGGEGTDSDAEGSVMAE